MYVIVNTYPHTGQNAESSLGTVSVPMQHATYEALHKMGENFQEFMEDKKKTLLLECKHNKEENKVDITSKFYSIHFNVIFVSIYAGKFITGQDG